MEQAKILDGQTSLDKIKVDALEVEGLKHHPCNRDRCHDQYQSSRILVATLEYLGDIRVLVDVSLKVLF